MFKAKFFEPTANQFGSKIILYIYIYTHTYKNTKKFTFYSLISGLTRNIKFRPSSKFCFATIRETQVK